MHQEQVLADQSRGGPIVYDFKYDGGLGEGGGGTIRVEMPFEFVDEIKRILHLLLASVGDAH